MMGRGEKCIELHPEKSVWFDCQSEPPGCERFRAGTLLSCVGFVDGRSKTFFGMLTGVFWNGRDRRWCVRIFWSHSGLVGPYLVRDVESQFKSEAWKVEVY